MPAVLMELGFINNTMDNQMFDQRFDEMVDSIVAGVEQAIPLESLSNRYGVQVGLFRHESNAQYLKEQLESQGYFVTIRWDDPYYAVIIGRETTLEDAKALQDQLRQDGYDTLIVRL